MDIEQLGYRIIGCALEAHRSLGGCGLVESLYEDAFCYELEQAKLPYHSPLKIDLMVDEKIIVECKAAIDYNPVFESQLLTYLRLAKKSLGYVINFGEPVLKNGIHRVVNDHR